MSNSENLLGCLDRLWDNYFRCKSFFPADVKRFVGQRQIPVYLYYAEGGSSIAFEFNEDISNEQANQIHEIGHWVSQSFVVRLYALLESYQKEIFVENSEGCSKRYVVNERLNGAKFIKVVKGLRNYFAHSSGRFRPDRKDHRKTMELMRECLEDMPDGEPSKWPLGIDTVLEPLFKGCRAYAEAALAET